MKRGDTRTLAMPVRYSLYMLLHELLPSELTNMGTLHKGWCLTSATELRHTFQNWLVINIPARAIKSNAMISSKEVKNTDTSCNCQRCEERIMVQCTVQL